MLHQGVRVRDLQKSDKWAPTSDAEMMIVHVVAPKAEEAPAVEAAAAGTAAKPAQPEVIKKGKKEEDEGRGGKKDKKQFRSWFLVSAPPARDTPGRATTSGSTP